MEHARSCGDRCFLFVPWRSSIYSAGTFTVMTVNLYSRCTSFVRVTKRMKSFQPKKGLHTTPLKIKGEHNHAWVQGKRIKKQSKLVTWRLFSTHNRLFSVNYYRLKSISNDSKMLFCVCENSSCWSVVKIKCVCPVLGCNTKKSVTFYILLISWFNTLI